MLTFRQPLLPWPERQSTRCHCDGLQVVRYEAVDRTPASGTPQSPEVITVDVSVLNSLQALIDIYEPSRCLRSTNCHLLLAVPSCVKSSFVSRVFLCVFA